MIAGIGLKEGKTSACTVLRTQLTFYAITAIFEQKMGFRYPWGCEESVRVRAVLGLPISYVNIEDR
jgi:hypothetical protein